jgi:hypothetical protein
MLVLVRRGSQLDPIGAVAKPESVIDTLRAMLV